MYRLTEQEIRIIEDVLSSGNRVELIPMKDRVKIIQLIHKDVSPEVSIVIKERPKTE